MGDSKDPVRKEVRLLFRELCSFYPPNKLFNHIMDGLESRNARLRTGEEHTYTCTHTHTPGWKDMCNFVMLSFLRIHAPNNAMHLIIMRTRKLIACNAHAIMRGHALCMHNTCT